MLYRYRIEPTPAQQRMLSRVFGCCRVQSFRLTRNGFRVHPDGRLFVAKVGLVRVR